MASNSPMECGVCNEEFNEDNFCPRILYCSHTLCTECVKQLIAKGTKTCPFCRANFDWNSATDVNVNHAFLDLIKFLSVKSPKEQKQNTIQEEVTPLKKRINDFKKETVNRSKKLLGTYQDMLILIETSLKDIEESGSDIKGQDERLRDEILRRFTERLKLNEQHADELDTQKHALLAFVDDIKTKKNELENVLKKLDVVYTLKEAGSVVEEAEETYNNADGWGKNTLHSLLKRLNSIRLTVMNVNVTKKLVNDTLELLKDSERSSEEIDQMVTTVPSMLTRISCASSMIGSVKDIGETVFKSLVRQRQIFAVQQQGESTRTATITLRNDQIFLHHLRNESPPSNVYLIEHKDLLSLEDPSSRLTFFELGADETTLGQLLIRLSPDTAAARNFALLCTGETGPSYAGTNLISVEYGSLYGGVRGGDYEFNNGTGGKPLITGLREVLSKKEYERPSKAGTVWGYIGHEFVQFCITIENPGCVQCQSFGIVEEGVKILKDAITRFPDIKQVKVQDCGAVLSYSFKK